MIKTGVSWIKIKQWINVPYSEFLKVIRMKLQTVKFTAELSDRTYEGVASVIASRRVWVKYKKHMNSTKKTLLLRFFHVVATINKGNLSTTILRSGETLSRRFGRKIGGVSADGETATPSTKRTFIVYLYNEDLFTKSSWALWRPLRQFALGVAEEV